MAQGKQADRQQEDGETAIMQAWIEHAEVLQEVGQARMQVARGSRQAGMGLEQTQQACMLQRAGEGL